MNSNIKRVLVALLTTITAICLMMFTAMNFGGNVFADQTYIPVEFTSTTEFDFAMQDGASVKVANFNAGVERALRFTTKLKKTDLPEGDGVRVVTIITLTDLLKDAGLNDSKFTVENLKGLSVKYSSVIFSSENGNLTPENDGDYYVYNACLYNIQDKNYTKEFSARSYVTNSEGQITQYTTYTYNPETLDNAGALWEVANAHKENIVDDEENTDFGPNANMTEKAYVSSLCQTYTVTAKGFDNATSDFTVKHGEKLSVDTVKESANIYGTAYFNGTATIGEQEFDFDQIIIEDKEIELSMFTIGFNETSSGYAVAKGTLMNATEFDGTYVVPATYNGKDVVSVTSGAFNTSAKLQKIYLPESVKTLNPTAFRMCTNLEVLYAPGVTGTLNETAYNCTSLKTVVVGNATTFGSSWIRDKGDAQLDIYVNHEDISTLSISINTTATLFTKKIYILGESGVGTYTYNAETREIKPNDDTHYLYVNGTVVDPSIPALNFTYNESKGGYTLTSLGSTFKVYYPNGVFNCPETYDNDINGSHPVVAIGNKVFNENTYLKKVILPESVTTLGTQSFRRCTAMTYFDARGLTAINTSGAMYGCDNLTTIILGKNCTKIGTTYTDALEANATKYRNICSIYFYGTAKEFAMTIGSKSNTLNFNVYVYNETETAPYAWRFVDGVAKAYNDTSYYTYDTSNNILTEPTA